MLKNAPCHWSLERHKPFMFDYRAVLFCFSANNIGPMFPAVEPCKDYRCLTHTGLGRGLGRAGRGPGLSTAQARIFSGPDPHCIEQLEDKDHAGPSSDPIT